MAKLPEVIQRVQQIQTVRASRADVTADRILAELARIGFADITQAVKVKKGKVIVTDTDQLAADTKQAISEIRQGRDGITVKFHEKVQALQQLGKHLGLFKENVELDVNIGLADLVNGSYQVEREGKLIDQVDGNAPADTSPMLPAPPPADDEPL